MSEDPQKSTIRQWAEFRFSVIGHLLAAPPKKGKLKAQIEALAQKFWKHPITGNLTQFSFSTIEGWYYQARNPGKNPVDVLKNKIRSDLGKSKSLNEAIKQELVRQYAHNPNWSYQLHFDNLQAMFKLHKISYPSVRRYMKSHGMIKKKMPRTKDQTKVFNQMECRSYENEYCNGLWHADYHHGSMQILTKEGVWQKPVIAAIIDDHSRLICHAQWYLHENTCNLVHAFSQAVLKRGLPRSFLSDNGSPFIAQEFVQGLTRMSITVDNTLPYSPWQNGKQERFFSTLEGRLMNMLQNKQNLTLKNLNDFTMAWIEQEYHRTKHREINKTPLECFMDDVDVGRTAPSYQELQTIFCREENRRQRRTDGSISLDSIRFEIPSQYRFFENIWVRYAQWDLSTVYMVDHLTGVILARIYPANKGKNASGERKIIDPGEKSTVPETPPNEVAPLLLEYKKQMDKIGVPNYLTKDEDQ